MIHVRFEGRSFDISEQKLELQLGASDQDIRQRLAQHLDIAVQRLAGYVVDRRPGGGFIVRPEAVYGRLRW